MRVVWLSFLVVALISSCGRPIPGPAPKTVAQVEADAVAAAVARLVTFPRFDDTDPYDWEARRPSSYPIHGIDASRWQGDINWAKAHRKGVNFAVLKATEGGDLKDPKFDDLRRGAIRAGVPWSAYHYFYFCRSAAEQARWFIRNVPRGADLPHVLDMEWTPHSKTCTKRPSGAKVRAEAREFLAILHRHYGRRPMIYTTVDFYKDTGIGQIGGTDFWLRSVAGHPSEVYPGAKWTFWQYTGTGVVPGIDGEVDINLFRGTPEAWLSWQNGSGASVVE